MCGDIFPHEFAQYLGGRLVLVPAHLKERFTQFPLNPYP